MFFSCLTDYKNKNISVSIYINTFRCSSSQIRLPTAMEVTKIWEWSRRDKSDKRLPSSRVTCPTSKDGLLVIPDFNAAWVLDHIILLQRVENSTVIRRKALDQFRSDVSDSLFTLIILPLGVRFVLEFHKVLYLDKSFQRCMLLLSWTIVFFCY